MSIARADATAATSDLNSRPDPTNAQKRAGNYPLGHCSIDGLRISIENPAGTRRRPEWPPLKHSYGYIKGSLGADGDHLDVFLGPLAADSANPVFVIDQIDSRGKFDEHKCLLGFPDRGAARRGYLANYTPGWRGLGAITEMSFSDFRRWAMDASKTNRPAGTIERKT